MSRNSRYYTAPVPNMPPGLMELMDGLARDVLKNNPTDLYHFCSDHMKKLLQIRDKTDEKASLMVKQPKTLEQKIAVAKKIINERALLRREKYDKNIEVLKAQTLENIDIKEDYVKNVDTEKYIKTEVTDFPEQYIKDNVIKIDELDLSGNTEHEIAVTCVNIKEKIHEESKDNFDVDIVNDNENLNKELILVTDDKAGLIHGDGNVTEDVSLKGDLNDDGMSLIAIENNDDTKKTLNSNDVNESISTVVTQSSNDEIVKNDTEVVVGSGLTDEQKEDVKSNKNGSEKINAVDKIEDKRVTDSQVTDKGIEDDKPDISITKKIESLDSGNNVNSDDLKNNDKTSSENKIDNNNKELVESETELIIKPPLSIDNDNSNENNIINDKPSDCSSESTHIEVSALIDDKADENEKLEESLHGETLSGHKPSPLINDDVKKENQKLASEVNNSSMDLETAAITIQKVFRSFLFRNKTLSVDDATNVDISLLIEDKDQKNDNEILSGISNKDRRALGLSRIDSVLQTVNEEQSLSLSTDDSSTLSSAATIIQAHVRGFLVRNKLTGNKANSSTSGFDSDGHSTTSFEIDNDGRKNRTVLNIHIVPEGGHFMSRDESMLTSFDLSVDGSPRETINLHPMSYDTSERRKLLKREDAIQSISPPSNNSDKQSEEVDSVKEILENELKINLNECNGVKDSNTLKIYGPNENLSTEKNEIENLETQVSSKIEPLSPPSLASDEMDVVTPFAGTEPDSESRMIHSGEFHDVLLPTKVSRSDTSVVSEFHNVLVYFLLWNNA